MKLLFLFLAILLATEPVMPGNTGSLRALGSWPLPSLCPLTGGGIPVFAHFVQPSQGCATLTFLPDSFFADWWDDGSLKHLTLKGRDGILVGA